MSSKPKTKTTKESPVKAMRKTIQTSPTKNSPDKMALRLKSLRQTMNSSFAKSPRVPSPKILSPKLQIVLKKVSAREAIRNDVFELLKENLKNRDLPALLKVFKYRPDTIEKIIKTLEVLEMKNFSDPKDLANLRVFLESEITPSDCFNYVLRRYFEKSGPSEFQNLLDFCRKANIRLEDAELEKRLRKEKKGKDLEVCLKEFATLLNLKESFLGKQAK